MKTTKIYTPEEYLEKELQEKEAFKERVAKFKEASENLNEKAFEHLAYDYFRDKKLEKELEKQAKNHHYEYYKEYLKKATNYNPEGILDEIKFDAKAKMQFRFNHFLGKRGIGRYKLMNYRLNNIDLLLKRYEKYIATDHRYHDIPRCHAAMDKAILDLKEEKKTLRTFMDTMPIDLETTNRLHPTVHKIILIVYQLALLLLVTYYLLLGNLHTIYF